MNNKEYAAGLRELAEFYENNPDLKTPGEKVSVYFWEREEYLTEAAKLAKAGGVQKWVDPAYESYPSFHCTRSFGAITLDFYIDRHHVCRKIRDAEYECPDSILEAAAEYAEREPA